MSLVLADVFPKMWGRDSKTETKMCICYFTVYRAFKIHYLMVPSQGQNECYCPHFTDKEIKGVRS